MGRVGTLLSWLFKALFAAFVIALPLLGVWLASSLAAYSNGPLWLAIVAGLAAFPALPLAWEGVSAYRQRKKAVKHILTLGDRLLLRTLAVNLVFLGVLLSYYPSTAFTALSTRGDWFLERAADSWGVPARSYLFWAADRLEWLYVATHDNPFEDKEPTPEPTASVAPTTIPTPTLPTATATEVPPPAATAVASTDPSKVAPSPLPTATSLPPVPTPTPSGQPSVALKAWPFEQKLHPLATSIPPEAETNYVDVARWIVAHEPDPVLRVKAIHDYVANRVAYDAESYLAGRYPSMKPDVVFQSQKGVCAGYAKLFESMGKAVGMDVEYIVGQSRDSGGDVSGQSHAWNAIKIEGAYYLVDVTWDSGYLEGPEFVRDYSSDYFLTPADVFGSNHFPNDPRWQLRQTPISRGDFMRQPNLRPSFFARGLSLVDPNRSQVTVPRDAKVILGNPKGQSITATFSEKGKEERNRCRVTGSATTEILCPLPREGTYHLMFFASEKASGSRPFVGQLEVNRSN